jgi:hypothetical protein
MSPALIKLLALLGQGGMVAGTAGMLLDKDDQPKMHGSYQDYLEDESIPLEERMKQVEKVEGYRYQNSPAHKARLEALKRLQDKK